MIAITMDFPILFRIMINSQVKNIKRNMVNKRKFLIEYIISRFFSEVLILDFLRVVGIKNKRINRQTTERKKMRQKSIFFK